LFLFGIFLQFCTDIYVLQYTCISHITEGGVVDKDGKLKVGDRLVAVSLLLFVFICYLLSFISMQRLILLWNRCHITSCTLQFVSLNLLQYKVRPVLSIFQWALPLTRAGVVLGSVWPQLNLLGLWHCWFGDTRSTKTSRLILYLDCHQDVQYGRRSGRKKFSTPSQWLEEWCFADTVNGSLVADPSIQVPEFDLPRRLWCTLNRFRTG